MNIIQKIMRKKDNSIYSIMKRCTSNGKLDNNKFDELMNPVIEGSCKFSAGFLEQFGINDDKRKEQVPEILEVIKDIYNDKISFRNIEKRLKEIDFKTLNVIDGVRSEINNDNYSLKTYETFKKLMYCTDNKEIFKFSMEMTALIGKCEELLDDYLLIGQYEEFSKYISFILCIWREKPAFLEALFDLLDESKDWGAIDYSQMLMQNKDIMADIKNQRRILIGALSKNCITMEICYDLALSLSLEELGKMAPNDEKLSEAFIELYRALFFERQPSGGILDLVEPSDYLNIYLDYLKKNEVQESKFMGLKYIREFLEDKENKDEIIEMYDESTYEEMVNKTEDLWKRIDVIDSLRKAMKLGNKYIYQVVRFIKEDQVFELIPDLEEIYLLGNTYFALEELLCEMGSKNIKTKIYENLKNECALRKDKEISHNNVFNEEYRQKEKVVHKMAVLAEEDFHDYELIEKLIKDYSPEIRSKALEVLGKDSYYLNNSDISQMVKKRLCDSPFYVRRQAMEVCKKYNLKISNKEKNSIVNKIIELEGNKNSNIGEDFENALRDIVN